MSNRKKQTERQNGTHKSTRISLPVDELLNEISEKRKIKMVTASSKKDILAEVITALHKRECK